MRTFLLAAALALITPAFSQTGGPLLALTDGDTPDGTVSGRVVDAGNETPIDYASVVLTSVEDSTYFIGGLTGDGGRFTLENLKPGQYRMKVNFLGYQPIVRTVTIDKKGKMDLGTIKISADAKALAGVEVTGEKKDLLMGIGRKVFDLEKNAITIGGNALDALRQVPTLQVDIDGNISLRGSESVTIFINGKNTGMSGQNLAQVLKSMPSSSIKSVELITNPSAKYDAAGISGIVNIITKKNLAPGNFGSLTLGAGNRDKYSANGSWNYRRDKLSSSLNLGSNYMKFQMRGINTRDNFFDDSPDFSVNNTRQGQVINDGINLSGNLDYTFTPKSSLAMNYMVGFGRGFMKETNRYEFLDSARNVSRLYERNADNHFNSPNVDAGLTYTKNLSNDDSKNELVLSGNFSSSLFNDYQDFGQQELTTTGEPAAVHASGFRNNVSNRNSNYTFQADYTKSAGKEGKIEAGLKANIRDINDRFVADSLDHASGTRVPNSALTNTFGYDEMISAAYLNYAGIYKKWGYQAGLRAEQTSLAIFQAAVNPDPIKRDYLSLFPSGFINRKWGKDWETQASASRRINRPNTWFLNPFPDQTDPLNTRSGNPYLNPEYITAYEVSVSKFWKSHSLTVTNFHRQINNVFQRIREVRPDGVSNVSFNNFGSARNMGTEIVLRNKITSFWTNTTNLNVFRSVLNGQTALRDYDTDALNWNVRFNSSFRFWKNADLQVSANYMAPYRIPQGYYYGFSGVDMGFRKDVLNGKGSLGINLQDVFNTRKFRVETADINYSGESLFKRESRWVMVNFTWKFGNPGEGAQARKPRKGQAPQGGQDINMGM